MKKIAILTACIFTLIIAGLFFMNIREKETQVTKNQTKVGVLLNGTIDDHSWSQSHYEAMQKTAQTLNLAIEYRENVPATNECLETIISLIKDGCHIIICNSLLFNLYVQQAAELFPEVHFYHASGTASLPNLSCYFGRMYQMRYLSGIVAGMQTETNHIGYVAAFAIDEVNRGINAFTLGVRSVNQQAVVHVRWSYSWTDEEMNGKAAQELLDDYDIDVLTMHTDALRPLDIAEQRGVWSIGYNMDNSATHPHTFLTAPVWQWEYFYTPHLLSCLEGKFRGGSWWGSASTGVVSLAPLSEHVRPGTEFLIKKMQNQLTAGTFDIFYGPIKDQNGTVRIQENESMSDRAMLNEFDWYVQGVLIDAR